MIDYRHLRGKLSQARIKDNQGKGRGVWVTLCTYAHVVRSRWRKWKISRAAAAATRTRLPMCVKLRVHARRTRRAYRRERVIRSLGASEPRYRRVYVPAGADLVVNPARGSFLEHVNTALSSENFGSLRGGGGAEFIVNHGAPLRPLHAELLQRLRARIFGISKFIAPPVAMRTMSTIASPPSPPPPPSCEMGSIDVCEMGISAYTEWYFNRLQN